MFKLTSQIKQISKKTLIAIFGVTLGTILYVATGSCSGIDDVTGLTCEQIKENPEQDVYFTVDVSDFNDNLWEKSQQKPETVRWNLDNDKFIIKYNIKDIPREETGFSKALNNGKTQEEITEIIRDKDNGWIDPDNSF